MCQQIFTLSIQLKKSAEESDALELNDSFMRALLVNLKCVYAEALIWSAPSRIGVWVVGDDQDFLMQSFTGLEEAISYMKVFAGEEAKALFYDIADGKKWREHNPLIKYSYLCRAETLALSVTSIGPQLRDLIKTGQQTLLLQPVVYGGKHSWISDVNCNGAAAVDTIHIVYPELFYRFSIN